MEIVPLDFSLDPTECLEYFRVALRREFPDLGFEPLPGEERVGWMLTLPTQREYTYGQVEALAITVQEDLFWKKDVLVHFVLPREAKELDESD